MPRRYDAIKSAITAKAAQGLKNGETLSEVESYDFFGEEQNGFQIRARLKNGGLRYFEVKVVERY